MHKISKKQIVAVGVAGAIAFAGAGAAYAYFTDSGTGSGSASTGTSTPYEVALDAPSGKLYPGGPAVTIGFTVTNKGSGNQYVSNAAPTFADGTGTAWTPPTGCDASWYTLGASITPADLAPNGTTTGTITITLKDLTSTNQDACKNASVPVSVTVS